MITLDEITRAIPDYMEFAEALGHSAQTGAEPMLRYLGVDPDLYVHMFENAPSEDKASGWMFGFTFALWYLNAKLNIVVT